MVNQSRTIHVVTNDYPLYSTSGKQLIRFSSSTANQEQAEYYEANCKVSYRDQELSPVCSSNDSVSSYSSCDEHKSHSYAIQKLVPTEPYWKRVGKTLDKNKKNIMMGCIMFVLVSLFIVSTVYFVKSLLVNNIVILSICAIMSLLSALIISILGIIWLTKYSKLNHHVNNVNIECK